METIRWMERKVAAAIDPMTVGMTLTIKRAGETGAGVAYYAHCIPRPRGSATRLSAALNSLAAKRVVQIQRDGKYQQGAGLMQGAEGYRHYKDERRNA